MRNANLQNLYRDLYDQIAAQDDAVTPNRYTLTEAVTWLQANSSVHTKYNLTYPVALNVLTSFYSTTSGGLAPHVVEMNPYPKADVASWDKEIEFSTYTMPDVDSMTKSGLQTWCDEHGVTGVSESTQTKQEMVDALSDWLDAQ